MVFKKLKLISFLFIIFSTGSHLYSAPEFPTLTGRVVDRAHVLSSGARGYLDRLSMDHEQKTGNQVVVVILKTLGGYDISDYGYQLGRKWGIGQKDQNNGALLIVAMQEKKIRIEVGYGLEGLLTDAKSKYIIEWIIKPEFKKGNIDRGIIAGLATMVQVLEKTEGKDFDRKVAQSTRAHGKSGGSWFTLLFTILFVIYFIFNGMFGRSRYRGGYYGGGGFGGFGGGGGGFSGGGGSFGGGGASGGW